MSDKAISRMYYLCSLGQIVAATFFGVAGDWLPCAIFAGMSFCHAWAGWMWLRISRRGEMLTAPHIDWSQEPDIQCNGCDGTFKAEVMNPTSGDWWLCPKCFDREFTPPTATATRTDSPDR